MDWRPFAVFTVLTGGALQAMDLGTTAVALAHGGMEGNPAAAGIMASLGLPAWFVIKAGAVLMLGLLADHLVRATERELQIVAAVGWGHAVFMAAIVGHNVGLAYA